MVSWLWSSSSLHWKRQTDNTKLTSIHKINVYTQTRNLYTVVLWSVQHTHISPYRNTGEDFKKVCVTFYLPPLFSVVPSPAWVGSIFNCFHGLSHWTTAKYSHTPISNQSTLSVIFMVNKEDDRQQSRKREHIEISRTQTEWKLNFPCWWYSHTHLSFRMIHLQKQNSINWKRIWGIILQIPISLCYKTLKKTITMELGGWNISTLIQNMQFLLHAILG